MRAVTFVFVFFAITASGADWPQFLGPTRNGISTETNLSRSWPKEGPPVRWRFAVGQGWSGPVSASNRVIVFHRIAGEERIDCLDALQGTRLWQSTYTSGYRDDFGFDEGPRATPAIDGNHVFTFGANGALNCWSLTTGSNVWRLETRERFGSGKGFFGAACSPLVFEKSVILNIGGRDGAGIAAFDKNSGRVLWIATGDQASYSSPTTASISGRAMLLVLTRSALVALDPHSGKVGWEFPFRPGMEASVTAATPLVLDSMSVHPFVFISASYGAGAALLKAKENNADVAWREDDILSNHYATSVQHGDYLFGFDGRQEQRCHLRCIDWRSGRVQWSEEHFGAGNIIKAGRHLLILTERGELILAEPSSQKFSALARSQILGTDVRAHPALANGLFYARDKRSLVAVELRPGAAASGPSVR